MHTPLPSPDLGKPPGEVPGQHVVFRTALRILRVIDTKLSSDLSRSRADRPSWRYLPRAGLGLGRVLAISAPRAPVCPSLTELDESPK